jgi:hypothetical protein
MTLLHILSHFLYQHKRFPLIHHIRFLFCPSATVGQFLMALSISSNQEDQECGEITKWNQNCACFEESVFTYVYESGAITNSIERWLP